MSFKQNFSKWRRINFLSSHFKNIRKLLISPRLSNKHRHTPSLSSFLFNQHSVSFHPILTLHWDIFFYFTGISYQVGKLNASETRQGWNCNSGCEAPQHCTLPRCTNVIFPQTFSGSGTVSKPKAIKNYPISSNNSLKRLFEGGDYFKYWSLEVDP